MYWPYSKCPITRRLFHLEQTIKHPLSNEALSDEAYSGIGWRAKIPTLTMYRSYLATIRTRWSQSFDVYDRPLDLLLFLALGGP